MFTEGVDSPEPPSKPKSRSRWVVVVLAVLVVAVAIGTFLFQTPTSTPQPGFSLTDKLPVGLTNPSRISPCPPLTIQGVPAASYWGAHLQGVGTIEHPYVIADCLWDSAGSQSVVSLVTSPLVITNSMLNYSGSSSALLVVQSSNVALSHVLISGGNRGLDVESTFNITMYKCITGNSTTGFHAESSEGISVIDSRIFDSFTIGAELVNSTNSDFENLTISKAGVEGILVWSSNHVAISNSTVLMGGWSSVDIRLKSSNFTISGCTFDTSSIGVVVRESSTSGEIGGNSFRNQTSNGVLVWDSRSVVVKDNYVDLARANQSQSAGILFYYGVSRSVIEGNTILGGPPSRGIRLQEGCTWNTITGNRISNNGLHGMAFDFNVTNNTVTDNFLTNDNVFLDRAFNNAFVGNSIVWTAPVQGSRGFRLLLSTNNTFRGNSVTGASIAVLVIASSKNQFSNNFYNQSNWAITLDAPFENLTSDGNFFLHEVFHYSLVEDISIGAGEDNTFVDPTTPFGLSANTTAWSATFVTDSSQMWNSLNRTQLIQSNNVSVHLGGVVANVTFALLPLTYQLNSSANATIQAWEPQPTLVGSTVLNLSLEGGAVSGSLTVQTLSPGQSYDLYVNGTLSQRLSADAQGQLIIPIAFIKSAVLQLRVG